MKHWKALLKELMQLTSTPNSLKLPSRSITLSDDFAAAVDDDGAVRQMKMKKGEAVAPLTLSKPTMTVEKEVQCIYQDDLVPFHRQYSKNFSQVDATVEVTIDYQKRHKREIKHALCLS